MRKSALLGLPLLALASPSMAQGCEVECETIYQAEQDLVHYNRHTEPTAEVLISVSDVIVVNGGLTDPKGDIAYSLTSVDLLNNASNRLENALLQIPGLQQFRRSDARSANPTSQGITMRGLGGNASSRVLLILDGAPQSDPFGGWVAWPGYDALDLAQVRARIGGGAGSDGPGALAGTVNLESSRNSPAAKFSAAYGSWDSVNGKALLARKIGGGSLSVSGSFARGDGYIPIVKSQRGAVDRAAPYEQGGVAVRAVAPLTTNTELQAGLRAFFDQRDRGFDFSDSENSGVDASLRLVNRSSNGWQWSALGYVQIREFASRFGSISAGRASVVPVLDQYSVPSTGLGARFELRPQLGNEAELRIGGDWRRTIGETNENFFFNGLVPGRSRRAGGNSDTIGGFLDGSWMPTERLTLTAGGRIDRWSIARGFRKEVNIGGTGRSDDKFANRSGMESTGRAAFALQASDIVKLRGAAYLGWRLPTLNELYRPFRVGADATAANELLAPERLKGTEIGFDVSASGLTFGATAFVNRLNNAIANVTSGLGPGNFPGVGFVAAGGIYRQRQNLDAIESKGIDLDAGYKLGNLTVEAGYAYVDAKVVSSGAAAGLDGLRPAQVPKHFGNIGFRYDTDRARLNLIARYVGRQFEDDANLRGLKSAFTVDAGISFNLAQQFRLELRGENLFDARVETAIGSDGVVERAGPRTIWAGVAVEL